MNIILWFYKHVRKLLGAKLNSFYNSNPENVYLKYLFTSLCFSLVQILSFKLMINYKTTMESKLLLYHFISLFFSKGTNNCKIALPELYQD